MKIKKNKKLHYRRTWDEYEACVCVNSEITPKGDFSCYCRNAITVNVECWCFIYLLLWYNWLFDWMILLLNKHLKPCALLLFSPQEVTSCFAFVFVPHFNRKSLHAKPLAKSKKHRTFCHTNNAGWCMYGFILLENFNVCIWMEFVFKSTITSNVNMFMKTISVVIKMRSNLTAPIIFFSQRWKSYS